MERLDLYRYAYISDAEESLAPQAVEDILALSRRNNAAQDLTGLLLLHKGRFFQVLEGPVHAASECFERIQHDHRHTGLVLLRRGPIKSRAFPEWRMGYCRPDALSPRHRHCVLRICDLVRPGSIEQGLDLRVQMMIRYFLARFPNNGLAGDCVAVV